MVAANGKRGAVTQLLERPAEPRKHLSKATDRAIVQTLEREKMGGI